MMKFIRAIRDLIWIAFTGIWAALFFCVLGAVWCLTVVGIPFGLQAFKFAQLAFLPRGKHVCPHFTAHPVANILWMLLGGIFIAFFLFFSGILSCITVVGFPSGLRAFKFALLALIPFGATVERKNPAPSKGGEQATGTEAPAPDMAASGNSAN